MHGDVKCDNAVVTAGGEVRLIDYGFMCPLRQDTGVVRVLIFALPYVSPEAAWLRRRRGGVSDPELVPVALLEELAASAGRDWTDVLKAMDVWMLA